MKKLALVLLSAAFVTPAFASNKEADQIRKQIAKTHLSLAIQLATAQTKGLTCEVDAYSSTILEELVNFSVDSKELIAAVQTNPVLKKSMGANYSFKRLVAGFAYANPPVPQIEKLLVGTTFITMNGGVYGPNGSIEFLKNGETKNGKAIWNEQGLKWVYSRGTFRVTGTAEKPMIELKGADGTQSLELRRQNAPGDGDRLVTPGGEEFEGFTSIPSECEA